MTRAEEAALKAYPDKEMNGVALLFHEQRRLFQDGYETAEKEILALIESRLSEVIGDAQPKPALRAELEDLIKRIKDGQN
jgi:hypothetical protein